MILDVLKKSDRYVDLHGGYTKSLAFLWRTDLKEQPNGTYALDGDRIYAMVTTAHSRSKVAALLEAHEKYCREQGLRQLFHRPVTCKCNEALR